MTCVKYIFGMIFGSTALVKLHNILIHSSRQQQKQQRNLFILPNIIGALNNMLFVNCFVLLKSFPYYFYTFDVLAMFPFTSSEKSPIISDKHGIYELPHELLNDLRLRILEN